MITKWFTHKEISTMCPICSCNSFTIGEIIISPIFDSDNTTFTEGGRPMLQLFCDNCYYVILFAAKPIYDFFNK